jgi:hypothetical protein
VLGYLKKARLTKPEVGGGVAFHEFHHWALILNNSGMMGFAIKRGNRLILTALWRAEKNSVFGVKLIQG